MTCEVVSRLRIQRQVWRSDRNLFRRVSYAFSFLRCLSVHQTYQVQHRTRENAVHGEVDASEHEKQPM